MIPDHGDSFKFGGGATETVLHPIVVAAIVAALILMMFLPRKYVVVPFLLGVFLIPRGQQLLVGGFHFYVLRLLILGCWSKLIWLRSWKRADVVAGGWNSVDTAFLAWAICRATAFILLYGSWSAVSNQAGELLDALGGFYFLRIVIRDRNDVQRVIQVFAVIAAVLAGGMLNEKLHGQNIFGFLGGVPLIPEMRNGSFRAQGTFAHSLCAGTFGATLLPLLVWLGSREKVRALAGLGVIASIIMAIASSTSTAILAYAAGITGFCFWLARTHMRSVRWGVVLSLVLLNVVMKAPVWFVIGHFDLLGGSSSFERAHLVDNFIRNVSDWWLIGTNNNSTWGYDMWDLCNQYVAEGLSGGLATLVFFMAIISRSFARIGISRRVAGTQREQWLLWCLGVTLFSHVVAFFGISYFDQTRISWYALLAMIAAVTAQFMSPKLREVITVDLPLQDYRSFDILAEVSPLDC